MSRNRKFDERLVLVLPANQKAAVFAYANREEISVSCLVRRALKRELAA